MTTFATTIRRWAAALLAGLALLGVAAETAQAAGTCAAKRDTAQRPVDLDLCASLESAVRQPGKFPQERYQEKLATYLRNYCHRNPRNGWVTDKKIRDTGPFVGSVGLGRWSGEYRGTHAPVIVWYSPEMYAWLKANRPDGSDFPEDASAVPDGAMMVKEMFPPPGAACAGVDPAYLEPTSGAAIMVRASASRMTAGSGAGSASRGTSRTGRPRPRTATRIWGSANTARTATPRPRATRPSRP